jgi:rod shape-determining protein MreC
MDRRRRLISSGALLCAALAALVLARAPLTRAGAALARPLAGAGTWVSARAQWLTPGKAGLAARVGSLEGALAAAAVDRAELELLRDENAQLRDRLSFASRTRFAAIQASVTARDAFVPARSFVVDRGSDDGVATGAAVVSGNGLYVGKVASVSASTATVAVLTAPGERTAVTLLNLTRTIGVAEGSAHALMDVLFIPHDQPIAVNDLVVTSGLEDDVPAGLVVGVVNAVRDDPTAPFQSASVEPLSDARRTSSVAILARGAGL